MHGLTAGAAVPPAAPDAAARWVACAYAAIVAFSLAHFLLGLPIQISDSFGNMLKLDTPWRTLLEEELRQRAFLRPFLWAELKVVYDLSGGNYTAWFRGVHAAQAAALVALFVAILRPVTWRDAAVLPLGLAALVGTHTFVGTMREAFPVNTYLTILLFVFAATWLALGTYRWWNDLLAALLFAGAALTVESGLLVAVIFIGAALVGARGVSRTGLLVLLLLFAGYFYLRFAFLDVGSPGLVERSSGFGFATLEPTELVARFGDRPYVFYAYNVLASALSVLFFEPTGGVFRLTHGVITGDLQPVYVVNVVASATATLVIGVFAWLRRHAWLARRFERDDQLVLVFMMVLAANAVISYPYTKDVIMSPAGALFAVALCAATRSLMAAWPVRARGGMAAIALLGCVVLGTSWALRTLGLYATLRQGAYVERNDWVYVENELTPEDEEARRLMQRLRDAALVQYPAPPPLALPFGSLIAVQ